LANAIRLDESITDAASDKQRSKRLELIPVKSTYSTYKGLEQINNTHSNQRKHTKKQDIKKTSRGVYFPTEVRGKGARVKLASYEFHGAEDDSQAG